MNQTLQNPITSFPAIQTQVLDSSWYCLTTDDHHGCITWCWRERTNPANNVERHTSVNFGIMKTLGNDPMDPDGTALYQCYISRYVLSLLLQSGTTLAQCFNKTMLVHMCGSMDCLHHIKVLPWPAKSPNLSPIEHVWDSIRPIANIQDLKGQLKQLWANLLQGIQRLYNFLMHHTSACINWHATNSVSILPTLLSDWSDIDLILIWHWETATWPFSTCRYISFPPVYLRAFCY